MQNPQLASETSEDYRRYLLGLTRAQRAVLASLEGVARDYPDRRQQVLGITRVEREELARLLKEVRRALANR